MSKTNITNMQFLECFRGALSPDFSDRDAYVSEMCLSSMWGDPEEAADIPEDRIEAVGAIWDAAHSTVKDIAAASDMSLRKLAERFCIPYRTMDAWSMGERHAPAYVLLMMQECLGLICRGGD